MSSPSSYRSSPFAKRPTFLLVQDEPSSSPLALKGRGTLTALLRRRSTTALQNAGADDQDEEEAMGGDASAEHRPLSRYGSGDDDNDGRATDRRMSAIFNTPQMRSMRLIGNSNPRYRWERYWKTEEELRDMKKPIRKFYERTNYLVQQYLYIDRLLDSSLPHDLLNEYSDVPGHGVPPTICEEPPTPINGAAPAGHLTPPPSASTTASHHKVRRTPKDIYRATETTPLFTAQEDQDDAPTPDIPWLEDDEVDSGARIVTVAIYVNFVANAILLAGKLIVVFSVPSVSVLASLVDALLDFLSTAIVWTTTWLIARQDQYRYPIGRRRLEPLGVLVFSVIMITSFVQVALEAIQRLLSPDHDIVQLGIPAIGIMVGTILIKGMVWIWFRLVKNSSVRALASDASTDVVFNTGSIAFPIIGYYAKVWWLDALGGLLLSLVVIYNWSQTSSEHIKNLSGCSASSDQRNVLLYLTMRFAKTIKQIQALQAYHSGDKLNVEVDIVLDANTALKDSHDLSESLQYVLESVPIVDRAFVHVDYDSFNLPSHMEQQAS